MPFFEWVCDAVISLDVVVVVDGTRNDFDDGACHDAIGGVEFYSFACHVFFSTVLREACVVGGPKAAVRSTEQACEHGERRPEGARPNTLIY